MSAALHILSSGLCATLQDLGRPGYQRFGIPIAGALDGFSLRAANALVGNPPDAAALEILGRGPTFALDAPSARLAFFGAGARVFLQRAGGKRRLETGRSFRLVGGDVVEVGAPMGSAALYMAIEGGFDVAPLLGAVSTYLRGGFGGWQGRAVRGGDRLPLRKYEAPARDEVALDDNEPCHCLRVVDGPQADHFDAAQSASFYGGEYCVGPSADRMGARLVGPALQHARGHDIVSDGVRPGSIQIAGDGQPIALRCEHQTTGGYPKIANVISADLPALGRLAPGDVVRFQRVTLAQAEAAWRERLCALESLPTRLKPVTPDAVDLSARLGGANLISGVIDARL